MKDSGKRLETETAVRNGVELSWAAATRLITMRFVDVRMADRNDAEWVVEVVRRWTERTPSEPYGFLVDCSGIEKGDIGFRTTLTDYFLGAPRGSVSMAWYNLRAITRVMVEMFVIATVGPNGKTFSSELSARAWLHERGLG